jgi:hypothetical protein
MTDTRRTYRESDASKGNSNAGWCVVHGRGIDVGAPGESPSLQSGGRLLIFLAITNFVNPLQ